MKYKYLLVALFFTLAGSFVSCSKDNPDSTSIFPDTRPTLDAFEKWIENNYVLPYNVDWQYKLNDIETDGQHNLLPADSAKSAKLSIITKYMWFDAYAETVGLDFVKENVPRIIVAVGIPGYTRYRTEVVGSAEGGYKVTLSKVNALTDDLLKDYGSMTGFYFHTMHHEFMHILNQKKPYDESFDDISRADYVSGNWTSVPEKQAYSQGFVSPYSMENPAEDIAELYSIYVTSTPQEWNKILQIAGPKGTSIINRKLKMVREYMRNSWDADIDLLRNAILRRGSKIATLNLESLE